VQNQPISINSPVRRVLTVVAVLLVLVAHYYFAKWGLANMASARTDRLEIAALTTDLAPNDPQTHYAAGVLYDKTFLPEDQTRSLAEFERAAALSPNNYLLWLALGTARSRAGDFDAAEAALKKADELAPNYASVQWAIGNLLVRRGRVEEGFAEIQKAVAGSKTYAAPAVMLAGQLFRDDVERLRRIAGDSPEMKAALAVSLGQQNKFEDAVQVWNEIPADNKQSSAEAGKSIFNSLWKAHRYRDAQAILKSLDGEASSPGQVTNGGFEGPITIKAASPFDWQISGTGQPQTIVTDGTKHGGGRSLALVFNLTESHEFQPISQTVAVEPGATYNFQAFYRSDLESHEQLIWEIVDAISGKALGSTQETAKTANWTQLTSQFTMPDGMDGVTIRLARPRCSSPVCPATGRIWFDDLSITRR
jgi:tetratricopeptide (TPR) repeat protein